MTFLADLEREPWSFDILSVLRRVERSFPDQPRIGDSDARRDDYVALGEDPYLEFPASTLHRMDRDPTGRLRLFVQFLGLLGPQGALPLALTDEAFGWWLAKDDSYPRFLDLLNHRFLQLFYRAWADARPIAQHDRPKSDRFETYIGSAIGLGSPIYRDLDRVPDAGKLAFAGLLAPAAKSASRLRGAVAGLFGVEVEIEQFMGAYLPFDVADRTRLGGAHARLGVDALVGSSVFSVEDKIRLRITTASLAEYERFLPSGDRCDLLADLVFFYIGDELEWDLELALPAPAAEPVRLARTGRLGYTSWIGRGAERDGADGYRRDARFYPAERAAERRKAAAAGGKGKESK